MIPMRTSRFPGAAIVSFALLLLMKLAVGIASTIPAQNQEEPEGRHICPVQAIRNGTCDPNPAKGKNPTPGKSPSPVINQKRPPEYRRVAKQTSTSASCHPRVKAVRVKSGSGVAICEEIAQAGRKEDLPISSQKVGITIWKIRELQPNYTGARILWHPNPSKASVQYQAERIEGDPLLNYGDKVRLSIESPRDGYL